MSFSDALRKIFARPTRIGDGSAEDASALHEEFGAPDEGEGYLKKSEPLSGGAVVPGVAASEAAETGEEDLETEEAPPDPDP